VHYATRSCLSAGAAAWHCGRGPPVSPSAPPLFGQPRDVPRLAAHARRGWAAALSHAAPGAPSLFPIPALHAVTTPGPPPLPQCLRFKKSSDVAVLASPFPSLALLRTRPSDPPLVHAGDRATVALTGVFPTAVVAVFSSPR
jgi:hypothetical protein